MKKQSLDLIERLLEAREKGSSLDDRALEHEGFNRGIISYTKAWGYIDWSGVDYYATPKGYEFLHQSRSLEALKSLNSAIQKMDQQSSKLNKEMIKHTTVLKKLTWWIFGFTIINSILIIMQVFR